MKIAVNTRLLVPHKLEGVGWFTYEVLKRLTEKHSSHEYFFIFDRKWDPEHIFNSNVTPVHGRIPGRHPLLWYLYLQFGVKPALKKIRPDIYFSPDGFLPSDISTKSLACIHDIAFEHYPETVPASSSKFYRHFYPIYAEQATRIATVSEFSKNDLVKTYGVSSDKIDVVYNGANPMFVPINPGDKDAIKLKYTQGEDFFLYIGGLYPRKNLKNILLAFDSFKKRTKSRMKFMVIGQKVWGSEPAFEVHGRMQFKEDVVFLGRVNSSYEVHHIMATALALTYVSTFEGFGIPIIEAMNCDTAVITANVSSMPEIAGNAACFADPFSVKSIAECMEEVAEDHKYRKMLIENGRQQRQKFSWDITAEKVWESIQKTVKQ